MKRLLIADDEPRQRRGLAKLVRSLRPELAVLEAANGLEAIRLAREERPDAVLSDIRMPSVDGFEVSEQLQQINPQIVIAYVSAYEEFDYAARALRLGVVEYLLKPYTAQQVEKMLGTLEKHVAMRQQTQQAYRQLSDTLDAWRNQRLTALLTRPLTQEEQQDFGGILPLQKGGYVLLAQWIDQDIDDWTADESLEIREQLKNWLVGLLPDLVLCTISEDASVLAGVYMGPLSLNELESRLRALLIEMAKGFPLKIIAALSERMDTIAQDAQKAYKQARFALAFRFYMPQGGLITYPSVEAVRSRELPYLFRYEQALMRKLQEADETGLDEAVNDMLSGLDASMRYVPEKLLRRLYQVAQSVISGIESRLPEQVFGRLWADAAAVFSELDTYDELADGFRLLMHSAIALQAQERGEQTEEYIKSCIAYIQENYFRPLTLSGLGERFYFSPNYLSALIKSRTGVPFKQYLQTLRMKATLALLRDSDDKVSDIALKVGFTDPGYFNRIFKKQFGVSPDSYRRNVKSRGAGGAQE